MEKIFCENGNIVVVDTLTGRSTTITQSEIEDFRCEPNDEYTREWREMTRSTLASLGLSEFSICLIINGRFDHNKTALKVHLKRCHKEDHLEKIWLTIR
jgi:hypothetical protein